MDFETHYIEAVIGALQPEGALLQIGFGNGWASQLLRERPLRAHVLIEADEGLAKKARAASPQAVVIQGEWRPALSKLGQFDTVFSQEPSLARQWDMIAKLQAESLHWKEAQQRERALKERLQAFASVRFTKRDFDEFYQTVGCRHPDQVPAFLLGLKEQGQVDAQTYDAIVRDYPQAAPPSESKRFDFANSIDPFYAILEECLNHHMKDKSRYSALVAGPVSRYEDPRFFERVITHPYICYSEEEKIFPVPGPGGDGRALVMVVEKRN